MRLHIIDSIGRTRPTRYNRTETPAPEPERPQGQRAPAGAPGLRPGHALERKRSAKAPLPLRLPICQSNLANAAGQRLQPPLAQTPLAKDLPNYLPDCLFRLLSTARYCTSKTSRPRRATDRRLSNISQ